MYMETMDPMMVGFGVQLGIDLDKELGIKRKYRTLSQRDVPGESVTHPSMQWFFYFVYLSPIINLCQQEVLQILQS